MIIFKFPIERLINTVELFYFERNLMQIFLCLSHNTVDYDFFFSFSFFSESLSWRNMLTQFFLKLSFFSPHFNFLSLNSYTCLHLFYRYMEKKRITIFILERKQRCILNSFEMKYKEFSWIFMNIFLINSVGISMHTYFFVIWMIFFFNFCTCFCNSHSWLVRHIHFRVCRSYSNENSFQFQFVNSFLSLFYIAFYLQDQDRLKQVRYSW